MKIKNKLWLTCVALMLLVFNAFAQTTINGLVVVVNFKDHKIKATMSELNDMFNKPTGFNLWGNEASVREYFRVQTNNKIDLINTIISVDLDQNSDYYVREGAPGRMDVDVIAAINLKYPAGFTNLSIHPTQDRLYNFSMISQSAHGAGVAWEVWPNGFIKSNGQDVKVKNISHVSWTADYDYDVNTICHEYGHSVWNWTDYYRTGFCNLGMFDVMSSAGSDKSAMPLNPAFRMQRGWVDTITNIPGDLTATYSVRANNAGRVYRYVNPANPKEYLIFQAMKHDKFYQATLGTTTVPEGLAIWYVDEETGYNVSGQDNQYVVRLVQADNLDQMHDEDAVGHIGGDMNDLYGNGSNSFPNGHPWRWKNGGEFGITLSNITRSGNNVNFTVIGRTRTVIALPDINGTLTPNGILNVNGTSQSFTFLPDPGYVLDAVLVDDMPVPVAANPYTLTGIGSTLKTIQPVFNKNTNLPALPSPWQKASVGSVTGLAAMDAGKFGLEIEGGRIERNTDRFTYVYQTINGNGTIIAHVAGGNKPTPNYRAGIMIRESLEMNSVQTMLVKGAYDGPRIEQRTATGNNLDENPNSVKSLHAYNLYNWLKITRNGNEFTSYVSRDGVTWFPVGQQTISMPAQVLVGLCVTGGVQYYPAKATFDNVSVNTTANPACTFTGTKITGSSIGTTGAYGGGTDTREKAFDGNILNFFDASSSQAWTGLGLANNYRITGIRFFPRSKFTARMVGGKFQGSNSADFSSGVVDLATITAEPSYDWNCISVSNTGGFRYIRYISPLDGWGNVSEIEFYGSVIPAQNESPIVVITSPEYGSAFTSPAQITISATATDPDGSIARVEFYAGENLLIRDSIAPYSYIVSNLPAGTYNFTAKAFDNLGESSIFTVSNIVVTNNQVPTVSITSPVTNASFAAPATINIDAEATDIDGSIWKVEFYNGSSWLGSDFTAPYSYTWNNVPAGVYNITALAIDNLGASASSTRNNIAVVTNQAPTVSITSPLTNAGYAAPATIVINADAADVDGTIWKVEFYNGSTWLGSDFTAPYSYTWNNVAAGVYNITALAIDNMNATASSTRNNIAVTAPVADITGPACAGNNSTVTFELAPSKRVNAIGYGWYFTGSTQSFNPSGYQATLVTGNNYGQGQLCVGVSYSGAPNYVTYCITLPKCSSSREAIFEDVSESLALQPVGFPNPFTSETTINLATTQDAKIEVYNANGILIEQATAAGSFAFGQNLASGMYFVKITTGNKTETLKLVKE
jgi:M6 family metalloprotease-like protein